MSVLRYRPAPESSWHHYLYGPRRGGGEGWIILPEVAPIDADHLSRMRTVIHAMASPAAEDFSLSVVNLSLGEAGLRAGRGGLAILLLFLLTDADGQQHRFVHALACYDRGLDHTILHNTIWTFLRRVTRGRRAPDRPVDRYFSTYQKTGSRLEAFLVLDRYLRKIEPFDFVPIQPPTRELVLEDGGLWPDVLDVTSLSEAWAEVIQGIAAISAALYASVLPWSVLTTCVALPPKREGMIIRFLARPQLRTHDNPLIILEDLDTDRAAVTLLPVVEQEIASAAARSVTLNTAEQPPAAALPTSRTGGDHPPAPPMLLDEPDTLTDDIIDLSAPMASPVSVPEDLLGEPELTENVVLSSPAVARPSLGGISRQPIPAALQSPPSRRIPILAVAAAVLLAAVLLRVRSAEVPDAPEGPPEVAAEEPAAVSLGWVSPAGDAAGVWLRREPAGQPVFLADREPLEPGDYLVLAKFTPDGSAQEVARFTLMAAGNVSILCQASTGSCQVQQ